MVLSPLTWEPKTTPKVFLGGFPNYGSKRTILRRPGRQMTIAVIFPLQPVFFALALLPPLPPPHVQITQKLPLPA